MAVYKEEAKRNIYNKVLRFFDAFWHNGVIAIGLAALIFSLNTLAVKVLSKTLPVFEVAFVPSVFCWVCTSIAVKVGKYQLVPESRAAYALVISRGLLGAASLILYFMSIEQLPLRDAVSIFFTSPVIAAFMEWLIHGNNLSPSSMFGCFATVLGVFLVSQPDCMHHILIGSSNEHAYGMTLAIGAATTNAAAFVVVRMLKSGHSALVITWWYHLVVMLVTAVPLLLARPDPFVVPNLREAALFAGVSCGQLVGQLLLNRGFQLMSATRGSAINVLQVLFSYLWERVILHEEIDTISVLGGGCVMLGVASVALARGSIPAPTLTIFTSRGGSISGTASSAHGGSCRSSGDLDNGGYAPVPTSAPEELEAVVVATKLAEEEACRGSGKAAMQDGVVSCGAELSFSGCGAVAVVHHRHSYSHALPHSQPESAHIEHPMYAQGSRGDLSRGCSTGDGSSNSLARAVAQSGGDAAAGIRGDGLSSSASQDHLQARTSRQHQHHHRQLSRAGSASAASGADRPAPGISLLSLPLLRADSSDTGSSRSASTRSSLEGCHNQQGRHGS